MVARLLNQILVQSEKSRRNAYNSNSIATDSKRNVKTRSMLEKLCISMTEKSANVSGRYESEETERQKIRRKERRTKRHSR